MVGSVPAILIFSDIRKTLVQFPWWNPVHKTWASIGRWCQSDTNGHLLLTCECVIADREYLQHNSFMQSTAQPCHFARAGAAPIHLNMVKKAAGLEQLDRWLQAEAVGHLSSEEGWKAASELCTAHAVSPCACGACSNASPVRSEAGQLTIIIQPKLQAVCHLLKELNIACSCKPGLRGT